MMQQNNIHRRHDVPSNDEPQLERVDGHYDDDDNSPVLKPRSFAIIKGIRDKIFKPDLKAVEDSASDTNVLFERTKEFDDGIERQSVKLSEFIETQRHILVNENVKNISDPVEAQESRELFEKSFLDTKMTGAFNRNGLVAIDQMIANEKVVTVANFDLDHFRAFNEIMGDEGGDMVILTVASVMHLAAQKHGLTAIRMGGEEFTLAGTKSREEMGVIMQEAILTIKHLLYSFIVTIQVNYN